MCLGDIMNTTPFLTSCHCCGLVQQLPTLPKEQRAVCVRCKTPLSHNQQTSNDLTWALTLSALIFYIPAMLLPMLHLEKLGHTQTSNLLFGIITLLAEGYWFIGTVILLFSVILPLFKLATLLILTTPTLLTILRHQHRASLYRWMEWLGRWGMLDVMIVAILVAFVKLGDLVNITPGTGVVAFGLLVLLNLLASLTFNPHLMWASDVNAIESEG